MNSTRNIDNKRIEKGGRKTPSAVHTKMCVCLTNPKRRYDSVQTILPLHPLLRKLRPFRTCKDVQLYVYEYKRHKVAHLERSVRHKPPAHRFNCFRKPPTLRCAWTSGLSSMTQEFFRLSSQFTQEIYFCVRLEELRQIYCYYVQIYL